MNQIKHEELFDNVKKFLNSKGIQLQEGSYAQRIRQGCEILTESINVSQGTLKRAKSAMNEKLDKLRHLIHEHTAPKTPAAKAAPRSKRRRHAPRTAPPNSPAPRKSSKTRRLTRKG